MRIPRLRVTIGRLMVVTGIIAVSISVLASLKPAYTAITLPRLPGEDILGIDRLPIPWHQDVRVYSVSAVAVLGILVLLCRPIRISNSGRNPTPRPIEETFEFDPA